MLPFDFCCFGIQCLIHDNNYFFQIQHFSNFIRLAKNFIDSFHLSSRCIYSWKVSCVIGVKEMFCWVASANTCTSGKKMIGNFKSSLASAMKRRGSRQDPWGTPHFCPNSLDNVPFTRTCDTLDVKYDLTHKIAIPLTPNLARNLDNRMSRSMVSNAAI